MRNHHNEKTIKNNKCKGVRLIKWNENYKSGIEKIDKP